MKQTIGKVMEARQVLSQLAVEKVVGVAAFAIAMNIGNTEAANKSFEAGRKAITDKYFVDNVCNDQQSANQEFEDLLAQEVEVEVYKIKLSLLEKVEVEPRALLAIMWMIKDDMEKSNA